MVAGWHRIGIMRRNESACLLTDLLFLWVSIIKLKLNVLVWYKTHILTNSPKTTCSRHDKVEKCSLGLNCNHSLTLKIFLIENDYYSVEFSSWIYLNTASITLNNNQSINQSINKDMHDYSIYLFYSRVERLNNNCIIFWQDIVLDRT
jgi:hypothetical protein